MTKEYTYIAIVEADSNPGYGITFPDLPGCTSQADTFADVERMAKEALQLHLEGMLEDGEQPPEPTKFVKHDCSILINVGPHIEDRANHVAYIAITVLVEQ